MKNFVVSEIESLPPLPQTIIELQACCMQEDVAIKEIVNIIEQDPFLTADLIKYANSPLYGYRSSVTSVSQAVSMFGLSTTRGLCIASAVKSNFTINLTPYKITTQQFTEISNLKNLFVLQWYKDKKELHNVLIPCALMMHIGMVIISDCLRKMQKEQDFIEYFVQENFLDSEFKLLNCTQFDILETLFEHWNFDKTIIDVVHYLSLCEIPKDLEVYIYPLKVLNALISPFAIANTEQIKEATRLVKEYSLDIHTFQSTLEKSQFKSLLT